MDNVYSVYWYAFKGYRGDGISAQNWTNVSYEGVLYKVGHQVGNDELGRVKNNYKFDQGIKPVWLDLWEEVTCCGIIKDFPNKLAAKAKEESILSEIGNKDFNLVENVSGIREFRIATIARREILNNIFNG